MECHKYWKQLVLWFLSAFLCTSAQAKVLIAFVLLFFH